MKFLEEWDRRLTRVSEEWFYFMLLVAITLPVAILVMGVTWSMQRNFLSIACDTAAIQSAIVNTLHGNWFRDTAYDGPNLLGLHSLLVLVLIAPIYAMAPSVDTLFALQVLGIYSAVFPLYLVGVEVLRRPLPAFLIAAMALASPFLFRMATTPFHPETWILTAVFWSFYFYRKNRVIGFWASFFFAVSCGEQAALIYFSMGLAWLLADDGVAWRKSYGKFAVAGGLGWVIFTFAIVAPLSRHPGQHNLFAYNYSDWNVDSALGLIGAVVQSPLRALSVLYDPVHWWCLLEYVGIPLTLAFFSLRSLILLAPFPVYFLMVDKEFFLDFHAYYFQFAFLAGYMGFIYFLSRWLLVSRVGVAMTTAAALLNLTSLCGIAGRCQGVIMGADTGDTRAIHEAFAQIPSDAGVYSQHRYSAYLSNRDNMVMGDLRGANLDFKKMLEEKFETSDVRPEQIDYIVCDLRNDQCGWRRSGIGNPEASSQRAANISKLLKTGEWQISWSQNEIFILRRVTK